jgi:hypothetical protein
MHWCKCVAASGLYGHLVVCTVLCSFLQDAMRHAVLMLPDLCCCCCRANAQQPKLFVGMILILIFAEALALYGLIGE